MKQELAEGEFNKSNGDINKVRDGAAQSQALQLMTLNRDTVKPGIQNNGIAE